MTTWSRLGGRHAGTSPLLGKHGQCCQRPPATELAAWPQDPARVQRPCPVPELGRGEVPLEMERGPGCSGIFHFLCLWQVLKGALFLEEERRLCVHRLGAVPRTRRRVSSAGHQRSSRLDRDLTNSISRAPCARSPPRLLWRWRVERKNWLHPGAAYMIQERRYTLNHLCHRVPPPQILPKLHPCRRRLEPSC